MFIEIHQYSVVTVAPFLLYNSVMLTLIKHKHDKETETVEKSLNCREERLEEEGNVGSRGADAV